MLNQSHTVAGTAAPVLGILRLDAVKALTGNRSQATIYAHVKAGLFPDSIPLGLRAVDWPADEVQAVTAARVAGVDDAGLRHLVQQLHAARATKYEAVLGRVLGSGDTHTPATSQDRAMGHLTLVPGPMEVAA